MRSPLKVRRGSMAARPLLALVVLVAAGAGSTVAYQRLFHRAGEAAAALVPADASVVLTVDLTPSPGQLSTFKKIADAVQREGLADEWSTLFYRSSPKSPLAQEIGPYLTGSLAAASWGNATAGGHPDGAVILSLKDPEKVRDILAHHGDRRDDAGFSYYQLDASTDAAIVREDLVISDRWEWLKQIDDVGRGASPSIARTVAYDEARDSLPRDANAFVFISQRGLQNLAQTGSRAVIPNLQTIPWIALGATIEDKGIVWDYRCPMDAGASPALQRLGQIAPLDVASLNRLPAGAYGVLAYSQPGTIWDSLQDLAGANPEVRDQWTSATVQLQAQTGLSIQRDILPALNGNLVLAAYPSPGSADLLMLLDDAHGADPASLAAKIRGAIEASSIRSGKIVHFTSRTRGSATVWTIDSSQPELVRAAGTLASLSLHAMPRLEDAAFAQEGHSLLFASSSRLLDRALDASGGRAPGLASDPAYVAMKTHLVSRAQTAVMINLAAVMDALRPVLAPALASSGAGVPAEDIIGIFGGPDSGLVGSSRYDGKLSAGTLFLPLDYDRVVKVLAAASRAASTSSPGVSPRTGTSLTSAVS